MPKSKVALFFTRSKSLGVKERGGAGNQANGGGKKKGVPLSLSMEKEKKGEGEKISLLLLISVLWATKYIFCFVLNAYYNLKAVPITVCLLQTICLYD